MILFFDTETTGFLNERAPIDDPSQPYIVQLAAQLCEDDGAPVAGFSLIVNPGVDIPERAAAVHGVTTERARKLGISSEFALTAFAHLYHRADLIVAHNIRFNKGVIEAALFRKYATLKRVDKPLFCTMDAASRVLKLPPTERMIAAGFDKPKPPKLEECVKHFFNEDLTGAHDAMVDVQACRRVYFHLKTLEKDAA
jgi:DNA polymerase-3 subunit epsilon